MKNHKYELESPLHLHPPPQPRAGTNIPIHRQLAGEFKPLNFPSSIHKTLATNHQYIDPAGRFLCEAEVPLTFLSVSMSTDGNWPLCLCPLRSEGVLLCMLFSIVRMNLILVSPFSGTSVYIIKAVFVFFFPLPILKLGSYLASLYLL